MIVHCRAPIVAISLDISYFVVISVYLNISLQTVSKGLITGKKLLFITTRGSDFRPGSAFAPLDFQEPYLRTVFGFIGFTDIQFINANGLRTEIREQSLMEAKSVIQDLAAYW